MAKPKLRDRIASEAARLMLRRKETQYASARKRAARWLSRRKVDSDDMPTDAEIQKQLYALARLFSHEQQRTALFEFRRCALELMRCLERFRPRLFGPVAGGPVLPGAEITICVSAESQGEVAAVLSDAGIRTRIESSGGLQATRGEPADPGVPGDTLPGVPGDSAATGTKIRVFHRYPCAITVVTPQGGLNAAGDSSTALPPGEHLGIDELRQLMEAGAAGSSETAAEPGRPTAEHEYHADAFAAMRMLLEGLSRVELDRELHPEGEALYHSLQVFELGRSERPYDEEFLLACLLHDVGFGLDRRNPIRAALMVLGPLVTPRTLFLIEHRPAATEFLNSGRIPRSLRRSEHFDDLVLLARCDLDGRIPGLEVPDIDEALDYIAGLPTAWDEA